MKWNLERSRLVRSVVCRRAVIMVPGVALFVALWMGGCACDGPIPELLKLYQGSGSDLERDLTALVEANTEILKDCRAVEYTETPKSDMLPGLADRDLKEYRVKFRCDILEFWAPIVQRDGSYFYEEYMLGPCGSHDVYFTESARNLRESWFSTQYTLEYYAIEENLDDYGFCVELEKRVYGEEQSDHVARCKPKQQ